METFNKIYYLIHFSILIQYIIILFSTFFISIFVYLKCYTKDEELLGDKIVKKNDNEVFENKTNEGILLFLFFLDCGLNINEVKENLNVKNKNKDSGFVCLKEDNFLDFIGQLNDKKK